MPPIHRYACNECNFELPAGWGGYTYAVNDLGQRVVCPHPLEFAIIQRTTGLNYTEATQTGRVGYTTPDFGQHRPATSYCPQHLPEHLPGLRRPAR